MQLMYLWSVIKARWFVASVAFVVACAAAIGFVVTRPKHYAATASVMIDVKSTDPVGGAPMQAMMSPSYMLTQVDVIQSVRVASGAARVLHLDDDPKMRAAWRQATGGLGNRDTWIAEQLASGLDARPSRGSNVINVTYTASSPDFAASAANAFAQSYVETSIELRTEPARRYKQFFDDQARQMRERLEVAQAHLSAYQQANGIVATDDRLDVEMSRLSELTAQLVTLEGVVAESKGRSGQANAHADRVAEVNSDMAVANLRSDLSRQEGRLAELSAQYGDAHPQVQDVRSSIANIRHRLDDALQRASHSLASTAAVDQSRLAQLRGSLEQQRLKVLQIRGGRDQANILVQDVTNAQRSYDAVLARLNQTTLESQTVQSNISMLEMATEPANASTMRLRNVAVLGVLVGLAAACLAVAVGEWQDRRLRTYAELMPLMNHLPSVVVPAFNKRAGEIALSRKRRALEHQSGSLAVKA